MIDNTQLTGEVTDGSSPSPAPEEPDTFNERQKAKINEIVREASARATKGAKAKLYRTRLDLQRTEAALQGLSETVAANVLEQRRQDAMKDAAQRCRFFDENDAIAFIESFVKYNEAEGRFYVTDEQGYERLNERFRPMEIDELFREYASKKPYLVRSSIKPGAGAGEAQHLGRRDPPLDSLFGPDSDAKKAHELIRTDRDKYYRLRGEARKAGLI